SHKPTVPSHTHAPTRWRTGRRPQTRKADGSSDSELVSSKNPRITRGNNNMGDVPARGRVASSCEKTKPGPVKDGLDSNENVLTNYIAPCHLSPGIPVSKCYFTSGTDRTLSRAQIIAMVRSDYPKEFPARPRWNLHGMVAILAALVAQARHSLSHRFIFNVMDDVPSETTGGVLRTVTSRVLNIQALQFRGAITCSFH
ncbi:hypothetical protein BGZ63DRAFT_442041, partial [Mariannaea sp. PMI_226]